MTISKQGIVRRCARFLNSDQPLRPEEQGPSRIGENIGTGNRAMQFSRSLLSSVWISKLFNYFLDFFTVFSKVDENNSDRNPFQKVS